jgi:hypothetical protein
MSLFLEALTYIAIAVAGVSAAVLVCVLIVLFDDWTDQMAQRAVKRRYP